MVETPCLSEYAPSDQARLEQEPSPIFGRRTVRTVYAIAVTAGVALSLRAQSQSVALLTPIDPNFHAFMIGVGVFLGVMLAAVEHEGWKFGIGRVHGAIPTGIHAGLCMAALVALSGVGGNWAAGQIVEWQAFHGIDPPARDVDFTVVGRTSSRSGRWLDLEPSNGGGRFSIRCGSRTYAAVATGDRLVLPVQTGRNGVERVTLPNVGDLRHG